MMGNVVECFGYAVLFGSYLIVLFVVTMLLTEKILNVGVNIANLKRMLKKYKMMHKQDFKKTDSYEDIKKIFEDKKD